MHANILLLSNDRLDAKNKTKREIAKLFDISPTTVNQVRYVYAAQGLDVALKQKRWLFALRNKYSRQTLWEELSLSQLASKYGVPSNQVNKWENAAFENLSELLGRKARK